MIRLFTENFLKTILAEAAIIALQSVDDRLSTEADRKNLAKAAIQRAFCVQGWA
mgnify:FL=1